MGSIFIYELYYRIQKEGFHLPLHMFFCASNTPDDGYIYEKLDDESLVIDLIRFGGTEREIINNKELMKIFIPILRADYKIMNSYVYIPHEKELECNISIINGNRDETNIKNLNQWKKYSSKNCDFVFYNGGHFFIIDNKEKVAEYINGILLKQKKYLY